MDTQEKERLTALALEMGASDRIALAAQLLASVRGSAEIDRIIAAATKACGLTQLDSDTRRQPHATARCIIAFSLSRAGMHAGEIASVLNRDRSDVIYCRNKMRDALMYPGSFPGMIDKFAKFNELLYGTTTD